MTAYTPARRSARYDLAMASGLSPRLKASSTSSRSTLLSPTRNTPGGSSRRGTVTVKGSKSTVDMVGSLLSSRGIDAGSSQGADRSVARLLASGIISFYQREFPEKLVKPAPRLVQPRFEVATGIMADQGVGGRPIAVRPGIGTDRERMERR